MVFAWQTAVCLTLTHIISNERTAKRQMPSAPCYASTQSDHSAIIIVRCWHSNPDFDSNIADCVIVSVAKCFCILHVVNFALSPSHFCASSVCVYYSVNKVLPLYNETSIPSEAILVMWNSVWIIIQPGVIFEVPATVWQYDTVCCIIEAYSRSYWLMNVCCVTNIPVCDVSVIQTTRHYHSTVCNYLSAIICTKSSN